MNPNKNTSWHKKNLKHDSQIKGATKLYSEILQEEVTVHTHGSPPHPTCPCSLGPCRTSRSVSRTPHCRNEILQHCIAVSGRVEEPVDRTRPRIAPPTHQNRQSSRGLRRRSKAEAHTLSCCSETRAAHRWVESTSPHRCRLHSRRRRHTHRPVLNIYGYDTGTPPLSRTGRLGTGKQKWRRYINEDEEYRWYRWRNIKEKTVWLTCVAINYMSCLVVAHLKCAKNCISFRWKHRGHFYTHHPNL